MSVIHFYSDKKLYGEFSNFYPAPIQLKGKTWPTSEHYFQAMKVPTDESIMESIRTAKSPHKAAKMGRSRDIPLRPDWEQVKEQVMMEALRAKFTQHPELLKVLLSTHDAILIEHTKNDSYWGDGHGQGKNRLGHLLMQLRSELRSELSS